MGRPSFAAAIKDLSLPALDRLFGDLHESVPASGQFDQQLISLFGGRQKPGISASLAYLLAKDHFAVDDASRYLMASPVHLQADSGRLLMYGQNGLNIGADEARQWLQELAPIFNDSRIMLYSVSPECWVLCLAEPARATFSDLYDVLGQDIHDYMPNGEHSMRWRSLINEVQMQLHLSPVNAKRQRMGLKTVNSLWFGGVGEAVTLNKTSWDSICVDTQMVRVLAAKAGINKLLSVASGDNAIDLTSKYQLTVYTDLAESTSRDDLEQWYQALQLFHDTIAVPIVAALQQGEIKEVQVYAVDGHCYRIRRKRGVAKYFRKKRDFEFYMRKSS